MRRTSWFVGLFAIVPCMALAATLVARDAHRQADLKWSPVGVMAAIAVAGFALGQPDPAADLPAVAGSRCRSSSCSPGWRCRRWPATTRWPSAAAPSSRCWSGRGSRSWSSRRRPISFLLLMMLLVYGAGGAIAEAGGPYTVAGVAGGIVLLIGLLIGSATCLNIMDRGTQPWLGLLFLAGNYALGYLAAPNGRGRALPQTVTGWVVAVLAAAYAIHQAPAHYREWTRVVNLRPATPPP